MLHHEGSPKKPQYNMATPPPFCLSPLFQQKFPDPPISINFEKVEPSLYEGGFELCNHKVKVSVQATCYNINCKQEYANYKK